MYQCVNSLFINEGLARAKELYLNTEKIPSDVFEDLVELDPTPKKKYIEWICRDFFSNGGRTDSMDMYSSIADFDQLVNKGLIKGAEADISRYKTLEQVADKVNQYVDIQSNTQKKKQEKLDGAEVVFDNDKCTIYHVLSKKASCIYGAGTRWCTAASSSSNYFNKYHFDQNVNLYYVIPKGEFLQSVGKHAVAVYENGNKTVFNAEDNAVTGKFPQVCATLGIDWD